MLVARNVCSGVAKIRKRLVANGANSAVRRHQRVGLDNGQEAVVRGLGAHPP
jgi:hypothetical protein